MKDFEKWTFEELVEYCQGMILKRLLKGEFESGVYCALEMTTRWKVNQEKKK